MNKLTDCVAGVPEFIVCKDDQEWRLADAHEVAAFLWGRSKDEYQVYRRVELKANEVSAIRKELGGT